MRRWGFEHFGESRGPYGSIDDRVATVVLGSKIGADACVTMS